MVQQLSSLRELDVRLAQKNAELHESQKAHDLYGCRLKSSIIKKAFIIRSSGSESGCLLLSPEHQKFEIVQRSTRLVL